MQGPLPDGGGLMPAGMDESPAWSRWMRAALRAGACASEGFWDHRSRLRTAPFPSATDELAVRDPRFSSPDPWLPRDYRFTKGSRKLISIAPTWRTPNATAATMRAVMLAVPSGGRLARMPSTHSRPITTVNATSMEVLTPLYVKTRVLSGLGDGLACAEVCYDALGRSLAQGSV